MYAKYAKYKVVRKAFVGRLYYEDEKVDYFPGIEENTAFEGIGDPIVPLVVNTEEKPKSPGRNKEKSKAPQQAEEKTEVPLQAEGDTEIPEQAGAAVSAEAPDEDVAAGKEEEK